MNIKNLRINKKLVALGMLGALGTITLTGCGNYKLIDTKFTFNKAIIFGDNTATIVEIQKWTDYDGEQIQIQTKDGTFILTSSFDTKLIDDRNSSIKAEDIARAIAGNDVVITYLDEVSKIR